jgi:solute:Na+ symporter, SSS family
MGFAAIDYAIVAVYLVGGTLAGIWIAGRQRSSRDYFLGGKEMAWWSVGLSIVASETSTLTFISVPGLAYRSNMHFLQLVFGYFVGRLLVSVLFIPAYYKGDLETAYDFLGKRFGAPLRKFASSVFIITRLLASGVRLFATAIPVHLITGLNYPVSILLIGSFTLVYTYVGGLKAVVAINNASMLTYLIGAAASMALIVHRLPGGWGDVVAFATRDGADKFAVFNLDMGGGLVGFLASPYTLIGGLLGGTFLTMASHGTDQLMVQRLLGCRSKWDSQRALMLDATVIVLQFAFFLVLGLCLFAFYQGQPLDALGLRSSDEIFPKFIVESLPTGLAGLVIAGVLASAMGMLSSSISSLASATYLDLFKPLRRKVALTEKQEMGWSRVFTLVWGIALIGGAMLFTDTQSAVVELGLQIASFTYGGLLGVFFLGLFFRHVDQPDAFAGFLAGLATMTWVIYATSIAYTWHTLIGCTATLVVGNLSWLVRTRLVGARA